MKKENKMEVTTKTTHEGKEVGPVTVTYDVADDLEGLVEQFGDDVVYRSATQQITVALQSFVRGLLKQGKTSAEIEAAVEDWKPGTRKRGKSPQEKILDQFGDMDEEARAALLAQLAELE